MADRVRGRSSVSPAASVLDVLEGNGPSTIHFYRNGKAALHDALEGLIERRGGAGGNVVLPSCVPSGVGEPIKDCGLEPRYHPVTRSINPEMAAVEAAIDDATVALLSVDYFGIPQPAHRRLVDLAAAAGVPLIEDNAHAPLSMTPAGVLLGTRGDLGFTSFHKSLPVRDGAALYVSNPEYEGVHTPRAGVRDRYSLADYRFALSRMLPGSLPFNARSRLSSVTSRSQPRSGGLRDGFGRVQSSVYEDRVQLMSKRTYTVLGTIDVRQTVADSRRSYRDWLAQIDGLDGVTPLVGELADGVCPTCCPVLVDEPDIRRTMLPETAHRWPPLPREVLDDPRFETSHHLADHLALLPLDAAAPGA